MGTNEHSTRPLLWTWLAAALLAVSTIQPAHAAGPETGGSCIVIDSDAGLDDFRAVAELAPTHRVTGIVVTEGLARPAQGAAAMNLFLAQAGYNIPIIAGDRTGSGLSGPTAADLPAWRSNAERLNGIMAVPVEFHGGLRENLEGSVRRLTAGCSRITVLMIGPWSSFVLYWRGIADRIDKIVAQGHLSPDGRPAGFNCTTDGFACYAAAGILSSRELPTIWVDIPKPEQSASASTLTAGAGRERTSGYVPTNAWVDELATRGPLAREVAAMMRRNESGWHGFSLWDDVAALYLLRPNGFVMRADRSNAEPCMDADAVRAALADAMEEK